jgi:hypothetical protein
MPDLSALPALPEAILERIVTVKRDDGIKRAVQGVVRSSSGRIPIGGRNAFLFRALGDLAKLGAGEETLREVAATIDKLEFDANYPKGDQMNAVTWALRRATGQEVEPRRWSAAVTPRINDLDELRFAALVSSDAVETVGPYTPARKRLLDLTGFSKQKLYRLRERFEQRGILRFRERGSNLATIIEFVMATLLGSVENHDAMRGFTKISFNMIDVGEHPWVHHWCNGDDVSGNCVEAALNEMGCCALLIAAVMSLLEPPLTLAGAFLIAGSTAAVMHAYYDAVRACE